MEGSCSTGQSPQWAVVPVEEEEVNLVKSLKIKAQKCNIFNCTANMFCNKKCIIGGFIPKCVSI
jgi:hypothetical protein